MGRLDDGTELELRADIDGNGPNTAARVGRARRVGQRERAGKGKNNPLYSSILHR